MSKGVRIVYEMPALRRVLFGKRFGLVGIMIIVGSFQFKVTVLMDFLAEGCGCPACLISIFDKSQPPANVRYDSPPELALTNVFQRC